MTPTTKAQMVLWLAGNGTDNVDASQCTDVAQAAKRMSDISRLRTVLSIHPKGATGCRHCPGLP